MIVIQWRIANPNGDKRHGVEEGSNRAACGLFARYGWGAGHNLDRPQCKNCIKQIELRKKKVGQ